jgi:hypothetical protein
MKKILLATVLSIAALSTTTMALAAGKGASSAGNGAHLSTAATRNSNGANSLDRDKGLNRAADRRNASSLKTKRVNKARSKKATTHLAKSASAR